MFQYNINPVLNWRIIYRRLLFHRISFYAKLVELVLSAQ